MDASNEEGMRLIQDLLQRPPKDAAAWALDQVNSLSGPNADVEQSPIFKIAGALKAAPMEHKQALVCNVVKGFGDLPAVQKAEFVRVAMRAQDVYGQAEKLELSRLVDSHHTAAVQRIADIEQRQSRSNSGRVSSVIDATSPHPDVGLLGLNRADSARTAGVGQPQGQESQSLFGPGEQPSIFVENLLRVAKEARFNEMPREDLRDIAQAAQSEAVHVVQPQQLLGIVHELNPQEREQLTELMVDARVVPEEQRGVLEEAVRPGGYADKLGTALAMATAASEYKWVAVALPVAELVIALILGMFPCGVSLVFWLQLDGSLSLAGAGAVFFASHTLGPVYEKLREDPVGAVQRWQTMEQTRSWRTKLERAVPGVEFDSYHPWGAIGIAVTVFLVLVGGVWAVVGVLELLGTMAFGCSTLTLFFCIVFIGLRFGILVCLFLLFYYVLDEIQKHRSRPVTLGSSLLPMADDAYPVDPYDAASSS